MCHFINMQYFIMHVVHCHLKKNNKKSFYEIKPTRKDISELD